MESNIFSSTYETEEVIGSISTLFYFIHFFHLLPLPIHSILLYVVLRLFSFSNIVHNEKRLKFMHINFSGFIFSLLLLAAPTRSSQTFAFSYFLSFVIQLCCLHSVDRELLLFSVPRRMLRCCSFSLSVFFRRPTTKRWEPSGESNERQKDHIWVHIYVYHVSTSHVARHNRLNSRAEVIELWIFALRWVVNEKRWIQRMIECFKFIFNIVVAAQLQLHSAYDAYIYVQLRPKLMQKNDN